MAETSCIKLIQNSQELASLLHPYSTLNYKFINQKQREREKKKDIPTSFTALENDKQTHKKEQIEMT